MIYHHTPHPALSGFCLKKGKESLASKREEEAPPTREAAVINPGILQIPPATRQQPLLCLHFVLTPEPSRDLSLVIVLGERKGGGMGLHTHILWGIIPLRTAKILSCKHILKAQVRALLIQPWLSISSRLQGESRTHLQSIGQGRQNNSFIIHKLRVRILCVWIQAGTKPLQRPGEM